MKPYKLKGGARIGQANVTYPLANLTVTERKLELNASVLGQLVFTPQDIIAIEAYQQVPIIGKGLKIIHRVEKYKPKVIFWTFKNPADVINEIQKTGFLNHINSEISAADEEIIAKQNQAGFPIKKPFAIGAVVVWNLLFAIDFIKFFTSPNGAMPFSYGIKTALSLVVIIALITLLSKDFQKLILKEGRDLEDIKNFLYMIIFICSIMLLTSSFMGNVN